MITGYMTTSEIAKLFGIRRKQVCEQIRRLAGAGKIDAKKVPLAGNSESWVVSEKDVHEHFKIQKVRWGQKRNVILHVQKKFPDANYREVHDRISKLGVKVSLNYVYMIIGRDSPKTTRPKPTPKTTRNVETGSIREMVEIISSMPKEYDIFKVIEIARLIQEEFPSLDDAEKTAKTIMKIAERLR